MTDQLREALEYSDRFWDDYFDERQDAMGEILAAARLVADGKVIPIEDTSEIFWCATHHAHAAAYCWRAAYADPFPKEAKSRCQVVSARLWLGETDESA